MSQPLPELKIEELSTDQRLELIGLLWESIPETAEALPVPEWHRKELDRRLAQADTNPEAFQGDAEGAQTMNSIRKVVFSKNVKDLAWSNSALKTEIVPEEIKKMKQEPGKNMLVAGSASIVQQLTNFGLVDEYHLLVHPVILGNGKPLFKDMSERHNLKLISTEVFKNGVVLLRYEPLR